MSPDDDDVDDWPDEPDPRADGWADYSEPNDDDEQRDLIAEVGSIVAGRTVVPAAVAWWRMRRAQRRP